jgi:MYXO-CTERM domain-containing protein
MPTPLSLRAALLGGLVLACLPGPGRGELITPLSEPIGAEPYGSAEAGSFAVSPALSDEYRAHGLLFRVRERSATDGYSAVLARLAWDNEQRIWVGAYRWWHVGPGGPPGAWANLFSFTPIDMALTAPADSLRVSFLWDGGEGTATLTGYTRGGQAVSASASGFGGATVTLDAPGVRLFTASASGPGGASWDITAPAPVTWGVSGVEVLASSSPEPGALALALLGAAGLAARLRRRDFSPGGR